MGQFFYVQGNSMNWYKKSQKSYLEIGHSGNKDDKVWAFIHGEIKIFERTEDHLKIPHITSNSFFGRFDKNKNVLSIKNPLYPRPIPNHLYSKLYDKFGEVKIMEFN